MIGKIIFKYGLAKIAPKVIGGLVTSVGVGSIGVICHKINSEISYQYDKKTKNDIQNRIINGFNDMKEAKNEATKQVS